MMGGPRQFGFGKRFLIYLSVHHLVFDLDRYVYGGTSEKIWKDEKTRRGES